MAWLSGFQYRKKITLSGSAGAGTNYQVLLKVGESSGSTGADFHVEGHSALFPSGKGNSGDLRFTASDETTLLDFWVEKVNGTSPNRVAYCWVEVSADLGTNQDIYCYYGNSAATNVSNGDNTFLFFDDFEGALDTTKWVAYANNYYVSGSILRINNGGIERTSAFPFNLQDGYIVETNFIQYTNVGGYGGVFPEVASSPYTSSNNTTANATILFMRGTGVTDFYYWIGDGAAAGFNVANGVYVGAFANNYWKIGGVSIIGGEVKLWFDRFFSGTKTGISWSKNLNYVKLGSYHRDAAYDIQDIGYDWILIRKFVSPEPAFSSAGAEEIQAILGSAILVGTGNLTALGGLLQKGTATLSGTGTLSALGGLILKGSAFLSGTGSLSAIGSVYKLGQAVLSGIGNLVAKGVGIFSGRATLSSIGSLSALGRLILRSSALLSGTSSLTAQGIKVILGQVSILGQGFLSAIGRAVYLAKALLKGTSSLSVKTTFWDFIEKKITDLSFKTKQTTDWAFKDKKF